jgi:2-succinyl-6-hydroxy-2,4-cyclohexadiene-1-carboxylate synthase
MSDFMIDGLKYHVAVTGEGPPLVLLHGFTGSSRNWRGVVARLAAQYRCIAIDLPGHGQTGAPDDPDRYQMLRVAADLEQLLNRLDVGPAHWLGYSMGGRLALFAALRKPHLVRSLILESASPGLASANERLSRREQDEELAGRIERDGLEAFVAEWEALPLFATQRHLPDSVQVDLRRQRLSNSTNGLAGSLRGTGIGVQPSLWPELDQVQAETLLLAGELDTKFVAINRRMVERMQGARLTIVPGSGHTIHLEKPERFTSEVSAFLNRQSPGGDHLAEAEQKDENEGRQRHLLEPRVERGQGLGPADGQPVADEHRHGQEKQELPQGHER